MCRAFGQTVEASNSLASFLPPLFATHRVRFHQTGSETARCLSVPMQSRFVVVVVAVLGRAFSGRFLLSGRSPPAATVRLVRSAAAAAAAALLLRGMRYRISTNG